MRKPLAKPKSKPIAAKTLVRRKPGGLGARKVGPGVVEYCVHGPADRASLKEFSPSRLIKSLVAGLPVRELDILRSNLDLPMEKLAPMLGISKATLHRRKTAGILAATESDRVVRFARLLGRAAAVMESLENARRWLTSPQVGLGGEVPLEYAETELGAREVEDLLGRIEYGVYS
jgi:putative toxin-antitoxin system antitoxin component (TIGR02293 family)